MLGFDTRTGAAAIRAQSGALLEFSGLYERMSAEDNLDLYGRIYHMPRPARRARTKELVTHLDLWDRRHDRVGQWSPNETKARRRPRPLSSPALDFLDEPTAGFDPVAAAAVHTDLAHLVAHEGVMVFLNTHNLAEAEKLCVEVAVIRSGRLLTLGNPGDLRRSRGGPRVEIVGRNFTAQTLDSLRARPEVMRAAELHNDRLLLDLQGEGRVGPLITLIVQDGREVEEIRRSQTSLEEAVFDADAGGCAVSDLWTMVWKEWKDLLGSGGPADWFWPLLIVAVMGIALPLSSGRPG